MLYYFNEKGEAIQFSKDMMESYRKELAAVFPLSFSEGSEIPVVFNMNPKYKKIMPRFIAGQKDEEQGKTVEYATRRLAIEETCVFPIDGETKETAIRRAVRYSTKRPALDAKGNMTWPRDRISISDNMTLHPVKDLDKIIFIYFFSSDAQNGDRANNGFSYAQSHGTGYFEKPDLLAKKFLDQETFNYEVHETLVHPSKRVPHEFLVRADELLKLGITGNEEVDRAKYISAMKSDPAKFERFKKIIADFKPTKSTKDLSQIAKKADEGIKAGVIQIINDQWCITTQGGEKQYEICAVTETKKEAKHFQLVEGLKADPDAVAKLNEVMAALGTE